MKHGKFILGAVALVVTAANVLAFKSTKGSGQNLRIKTANVGGCHTTTCKSTATAGQAVTCKSIHSGNPLTPVKNSNAFKTTTCSTFAVNWTIAG